MTWTLVLRDFYDPPPPSRVFAYVTTYEGYTVLDVGDLYATAQGLADTVVRGFRERGYRVYYVEVWYRRDRYLGVPALHWLIRAVVWRRPKPTLRGVWPAVIAVLALLLGLAITIYFTVREVKPWVPGPLVGWAAVFAAVGFAASSLAAVVTLIQRLLRR